MTSDDVLAVVVSFNGLQNTRRAVAALRPQVGHIHVVDNGSAADSLAVLASLENEGGVTVERLGENRGMAALNRGVARARELGHAWLLTMDQDSVVDAGMMRAFEVAITDNARIVSVGPRAVPGPMEGNGTQDAIQVVSSIITSGNLVKMTVFDEIGLYDESFFIDAVDFDFCLRLRKIGHEVYRVPAAVMQHQLGVVRSIPWPFRRFYAEHSPLRRYYKARNFLYLAERHLWRFPFFVLKLAVVHVMELTLVAFYDPHPLQSYQGVLSGVRDYFAGRTGPKPDQTR